MQVQDYTTWKEINLLVRSYIDLQQTRISAEHRIRKLREHALIQAGVAKLVEEKRVSPYDADEEILPTKREHFTHTVIIEDEAGAKRVLELLNETRPMAVLLKNHESLEHEEKALLKDIAQICYEHPLWAWCERTRGMSDVGAMTFLGYVNPDRCKTVGHFWAYAGLTPNSRMKSGVKATFNPELKGRIYIVARNIIMGKDPYYYTLYKAKKEYLAQRPDILAQQDGFKAYFECNSPDAEHSRNYLDKVVEGDKDVCPICGVPRKIRTVEKVKKRGWKGWVDNMAKRWLMKILTSHAVEIICKAEGKPIVSEHHPHIPVKPESEVDQKRVIINFLRYCDMLLEHQKMNFNAGLPLIASSRFDVGWREEA